LILVLIGFRMRIQDHFSISGNLVAALSFTPCHAFQPLLPD